MRRSIIAIAAIPVMVLLMISCRKIVSKSYSCRCLIQKENKILESEDYKIQAFDIYEAGTQCQHIEYRINQKREDEEQQFKCELY